MADESGDKSPRSTTNDSDLLPAILAIALAVVAQLAIQDDLTLLGLAGYGAAAWLFVSSVQSVFDAPAVEETGRAEPAPAAAEAQPTSAMDGTSRLRYLREHWRQVTIAEILTGDIPPSRLKAESNALVSREPGDDVSMANQAQEPSVEPSPRPAAQMESWAVGDSAASTPTAVKVTPIGDVLVLDTGLEQVQRFDGKGNLLATYALAGLAGVDVLDLDVSPDGKTLYIVDAASRRLQVIRLDDNGS